MREFVIILIVILVLLGLTAVKYRKQIAGLIGVAKMLKDAKDAARKNSIHGEDAQSVQLVNCAKCGVWVPQEKAFKIRDGFFYCSDECAKTHVT
jgi:hypothetical protein